MPTIKHTITKTNTYLVVFNVPAQHNSQYALTSCRDECAASAYAKVTYADKNDYNFINLASHGEADLFTGTTTTNALIVARTKSCRSQHVSCARTQTPIYDEIMRHPRTPQTYDNVCEAQRTLRATRNDDLSSLHLTITPDVCKD